VFLRYLSPFGGAMKRDLYSLYILSLLMFCSGCVAAPVGTGAGVGVETYSKMNRELTATYHEPLKEIWPKTLSAVKKLQLTFRKKEIDALGGTIEARRSDSTLIKIRLTPVGNDDTSISVRVGTWGDREKSELIHKAIRKEL
jgi:hypothetical protein